MAGRHRIPNHMDAIKTPRRPKALMPTLESNELMRLLQSAESPRNKAILTLIRTTGCGPVRCAPS
jgi:site-specific recombinase XerD